MRKALIAILFFAGINSSLAQELNCQVDILPSPSLALGPVDKEIFGEMKEAIYDFMNNTRWTNDVYEIEERINCTVLMTITDIPGVSTYSGKIQVQSSRPVYNTSYNTTLFNHVDNNFSVRYQRGSPILFSIDKHRDAISSILAYYAYMIIAYDYDSFEEEGGTPYFTKAQIISTNAKNSGDNGWSSSGGKKNNRYWIVENALHSVFKPIRKAYYNYHRLGFDIMYNDLDAGRKVVLQSIQSLDVVQRSRPGSINLQMFLTAKSSELINLFSQAENKEKNAAVSILKRLDPANSSKYQEILN